MKIGYDDGKDFDVPQSVIDAIEHIGRMMCLCQQKAETKTAWCWNFFSWKMDRNFQIEYSYGAWADEIERGDGWNIVLVSQIPAPKTEKPYRARSFITSKKASHP